jgi:hypothetical protein
VLYIAGGFCHLIAENIFFLSVEIEVLYEVILFLEKETGTRNKIYEVGRGGGSGVEGR